MINLENISLQLKLLEMKADQIVNKIEDIFTRKFIEKTKLKDIKNNFEFSVFFRDISRNLDNRNIRKEIIKNIWILEEYEKYLSTQSKTNLKKGNFVQYEKYAKIEKLIKQFLYIYTQIFLIRYLQFKEL